MRYAFGIPEMGVDGGNNYDSLNTAVISGRDYVRLQRIRANALPYRSRLARRGQHEHGCRYACSTVWSPNVTTPVLSLTLFWHGKET